MSKGITNRIKEIDSKLDEMRLRYKTASQGMKIFLEQGAKLLKSERKGLEKRLANENQGGLF